MPHKGLSEDSQPPYKAPTSTGLQSIAHTRLKIDQAGRLVIPAEMRAAMLVKPGEEVTAEVVDGVFHITSPRVALRQFQEIGREWRAKNPGVDIVQELINERRAEARQEAEEADAWRAKHGLPPLD